MNKIKKLYLWAEKIWFSLPQKIRFVLVGGFNTVLAYVILNLLNIWVSSLDLPIPKTDAGKLIIANIALIIQNIITINVSFITMRYYVFQSHGPWVAEYFKAWSVYLLIFIINAPIISGFMMFFGWSLWLAQAVYLIFATIITFILHKYYSFRQ